MERNETSINNWLKQLKHILSDVLDFRDGVDKTHTVESIKANISIKGHLTWILIASILIASLGLNTNSGAVVIGAMLISPLMGPIVGVGYSVATNDLETLKRSFNNLLIMLVISLLTSFLFFTINPIKELTTELFNRTKPTSLDVLIAIFGGFAGIIAASRKEISNVIPGVAIATALMPPLCTAGYGLAVWDFSIFLGAFYLFLLNSVFISLSTFLVLKFLKFPLVKYQNPDIRRKTISVISATVILVIVPSIFIFYNVLKETMFKNQSNAFISSIKKDLEESPSYLINNQIIDKDSLKVIQVITGGEIIEESTIKKWSSKIGDYDHLIRNNTRLEVFQPNSTKIDVNSLKAELQTNSVESMYKIINTKSTQIDSLQNMIKGYQKNEEFSKKIAKEITIQYKEIQKISFAEMESTDFKNAVRIPTFIVNWKSKNIKSQKEKLSKWLQIRMDLDTIQVLDLFPR